jgi:hypothetical protein
MNDKKDKDTRDRLIRFISRNKFYISESGVLDASKGLKTHDGAKSQKPEKSVMIDEEEERGEILRDDASNELSDSESIQSTNSLDDAAKIITTHDEAQRLVDLPGNPENDAIPFESENVAESTMTEITKLRNAARAERNRVTDTDIIALEEAKDILKRSREENARIRREREISEMMSNSTSDESSTDLPHMNIPKPKLVLPDYAGDDGGELNIFEDEIGINDLRLQREMPLLTDESING